MDTLQVLSACDVLSVAILIVDSSDSEGYIPSQRIPATGICLGKIPGALILELDLSALASQLGYPFQISQVLQLTGAFERFDSSGAPIVLWTVDARIDEEVEGFTIETVKGQLRTTLSPLIPTRRDSKCGEQRTFMVLLKSEGQPSDQLVIAGHTKIGPLVSPSDTITLGQIVLAATAGLPLDADVKIRPRGAAHCPPELFVENQVSTFRAWVSGVPNGLFFSYDWQVSGAELVHGQGTWEVRVRLPSPPQPVVLTVRVAVEDFELSDSIHFTPLDTPKAGHLEELLGLLCRLRAEVVHHTLFDPLRDPLRDLTTHPLTRDELGQMAEAASRLAQVATKLSAASQRLRQIG